MESKKPLPLIVVAAVTAVCFWSLKPIFITLIGDRAGYAEVFVAAGLISVTASLVGIFAMYRGTLSLLRNSVAWRGAFQSALAGGFLAMWYYGFYRALYGASKVDATIIAFSWPLISIFAMRIFAARHGRELNRSEYSLIFVAFLGAVAIGVADLSKGTSLSENWEILFAFLAAIGSGFYLPFAINAIALFGKILDSKIFGTFYTISIANIVSLTLVLGLMYVSDQKLLFYAFDTEVIMTCAMIGIGTYLLAEITWTWAFSEYESLTLSSLPYFSPAVSVVLLFLFFDEPVTSIAALGLALILFSNMTLHGRYRSNSAPIMALIGTVYVTLASQIVRPLPTETLFVDVMFAAISGLFAILAGFILSRVSSRRAEEIDARSGLTRELLSSRDGTKETDDSIDQILCLLIDLEFMTDMVGKERLAIHFRRELLGTPFQPRDQCKTTVKKFDNWFTIHCDRLSLGEKTALWITGLGSILFLMLIRGETAFGLIGLYIFAAGCLLVLFTINDYEKNNLTGFRNQFLRLQQGFAELGRDLYLPRPLVISREFVKLPPSTQIRYRDEHDLVVKEILSSSRSYFPKIYWATTVLVVGALFYLPISSQLPERTGLSQVLRPGVVSERISDTFLGDEPDINVAIMNWDANRVGAEVLVNVIADKFHLKVGTVEIAVSNVFPEMEKGVVDIYPDFWAENQPINLSRYIKNDSPIAKLNSHPYQGVQGIYTSSIAVKELNIVQFSDLTRPEVALAFDTDQDGLGEIWIGAPGWKSTALMQEMLQETGLVSLWEVEIYTERIFKAKLDRFMSNGRALIFYGYEPDWIHNVYELSEISGLKKLASEGNTECPESLPPELCSLSTTHVHIAYASRIEETRPKLAAFLRRVEFTRDDINDWLAQTALKKNSVKSVAKSWIEAHEIRINKWLFPPSGSNQSELTIVGPRDDAHQH